MGRGGCKDILIDISFSCKFSMVSMVQEVGHLAPASTLHYLQGLIALSGQSTIIHKPTWFQGILRVTPLRLTAAPLLGAVNVTRPWCRDDTKGDSLTKPPFGVTSAEVAIICPVLCIPGGQSYNFIHQKYYTIIHEALFSRISHLSGHIIIFHQPRFPWNKGS